MDLFPRPRPSAFASGVRAKRSTGSFRSSLTNRSSPSARIPERVGNGIAPVAAEIARGDLHPGRRLAAFIFRDIKKLFHPLHRQGIEALGHRVLETHLALDQTFQNAIQYLIR